jgi:hypothetical protein
MNQSPYDCPTHERLTKVYNATTRLSRTFGEIWQQMYYREFKPTFGHWTSPPLYDYVPEWFYKQYDIVLTAANLMEDTPELVEFETESLAVANLRSVYGGDDMFVTGAPV